MARGSSVVKEEKNRGVNVDHGTGDIGFQRKAARKKDGSSYGRCSQFRLDWQL